MATETPPNKNRKIVKKQAYFAFEKKAYKKFQSYVFRNGLSPQEFFYHIVLLIDMREESCLELLKAVKRSKAANIMYKKKGGKKTQKQERVHEDNFYDMFEEEAQKRNAPKD
jgi:hypothetical protein